MDRHTEDEAERSARRALRCWRSGATAEQTQKRERRGGAVCIVNTIKSSVRLGPRQPEKEKGARDRCCRSGRGSFDQPDFDLRAGSRWRISIRLLRRDIDFGVAAGRCGVHGGDDLWDSRLNEAPATFSENYDRDFPAREFLLVGDVFVGRDENFEASGFRSGNQVSILRLRPTMRSGFCNGVPVDEKPSQSARCPVVEKD